MLHEVYRQLSSPAFIKMGESFLFAFVAIVLGLFCSLFWKQWKLARAYGRFPSKTISVLKILQVILGRHPKHASFSSFFLQILLQTANEFRKEGLCVIWLHKPYIVVFNEKHMKSLVNEVELADKISAYEVNGKIFGNGLLASKHEYWKVHRKLLSPAFSVGVLKSQMHVLNKYAVQLADRLDMLVGKPTDEAWKAIKHCAFQNMTDFILGLKLDNEKHVTMAENFIQTVELGAEMFVERSSMPWLKWDFMLPLFATGRKYLKTVEDINRQAREIMNELMKKIESGRTQAKEDSQVSSCFGDIVMKLYLHDKLFTEKDVRDQLLTFAAAGYDTISVTMLWCFYALGHHPEVQEKAYNEIKSIAPEGDITHEDLSKLKYLECVIKETMRLHATVPFFGRRARKDIQCGQYIIPEGSEVGVIAISLHKDPNVFPEPEKFDPDRFSDSSKLRPWMYIPFFEGYRGCIGKKLAMMEMKIQLAHVFRRFRITSLKKIHDNDLVWAVTLKPTKPLQFSFQNRQLMS